MRKVFPAALALLLAFGFSGATEIRAASKTRALGTITGSVRDQNGLPMSGVLISLIREGASQVIKQTRSTANGSFSARIAPGRYSLKAAAAGFNDVLFSSVQVRPADEIIYRFNLEPTGSGRTAAEQRNDRGDVKWRLRSAHSQKSIFQAQEGEDSTIAVAVDDEGAAAEPAAETPAAADPERTARSRRQGVVETYFSSGNSYTSSYRGLNFAFASRAGNRIELIFAGQTGGPGAPQRIETSARVRANNRHSINLSVGSVRLPLRAQLAPQASGAALGQVSVRAIDEWIVRDGIVVVLGLDYSRFLGSGNANSFSPRIGLQFDANARTRIKAAYAPGGSETAMQSSTSFEEGGVVFKQPATQPIAFVDGQAVMERSRRFEFGVERVLDNDSSVEATAFFDTTTGRGLGLLSLPLTAFSGESGTGLISVANQQGAARGMRVVYTRRLSQVWSASAGYSFGRGQRLSPGGITNPAELFDDGFFQTAALQLDAGLSTGTNVRTVFRFSPEATVFAIDPFAGRLAVYDPSLSIQVTQDLPSFGLPVRAEAIIDARNLLDFQAQTDNGDTLTQVGFTRRSLRGGISLRF
ncbi:MAG: carboxypeptidase regulatory-like domain-containing protein [Pyrinomonadaceae bacterium]